MAGEEAQSWNWLAAGRGWLVLTLLSPKMVVGHPYVRPTGAVWGSLFLLFFIIGGVVSTLIPLTYGSQQNWVGRYLSSPIGGKSREELAATSPEDLGVGDLPPAILFAVAAVVAMSFLSCVIQKIEFPE